VADLPALTALRASQRHLDGLVAGLDAETVAGPSYHSWTIAQVLSHLGSGAAIFELRLAAGRDGGEAPGQAECEPIWAEWDAKAPDVVGRDCLAACDAFVASVDALTDEQSQAFRVSMFGMDVDLAGLLGMRLNEHAVHTWDIEVALDPTATVLADALPSLLDAIPGTAGWSGKPTEGEPYVVSVTTSDPAGTYAIRVGDRVSLEVGRPDDADTQVDLPAEALVRLVYGRLDPGHTPVARESGPHGLAVLRQVFQGF
jgi:uncharacterized protein (TIGR03083 family)